MKLVEGLKDLKTIEKRMDANCAKIQAYCAWVSVETPAFETEDRQRQEVASLIQANLDLEKQYLKLKVAIETTSLSTRVSIGKRTHSITELLTIKDRKTRDGRSIFGLGNFRKKTYESLSGAPAAQRMQQVYRTGIDAANPPRVICAYREEDKNAALKDWEEFTSQIDGRLEVVNAETDLLGYEQAA